MRRRVGGGWVLGQRTQRLRGALIIAAQQKTDGLVSRCLSRGRARHEQQERRDQQATIHSARAPFSNLHTVKSRPLLALPRAASEPSLADAYKCVAGARMNRADQSHHSRSSGRRPRLRRRDSAVALEVHGHAARRTGESLQSRRRFGDGVGAESGLSAARSLASALFETLKNEAQPVECPGRRAPLSAHENSGTDLLLDLTGVPCGA